MKYLIIILLVLLLFTLFKVIILPKIMKATCKKKVMQCLQKVDNISFLNGKTIDEDLKIRVDDQVFYFKILLCPNNCDLQINNIETWGIYKQGKFTYINEIKKFINSQESNKIVVLASEAHTIKKVINECEMIMVDENVDVYNSLVINYDKINLLKEIVTKRCKNQ